MEQQTRWCERVVLGQRFQPQEVLAAAVVLRMCGGLGLGLGSQWWELEWLAQLGQGVMMWL